MRSRIFPIVTLLCLLACGTTIAVQANARDVQNTKQDDTAGAPEDAVEGHGHAVTAGDTSPASSRHAGPASPVVRYTGELMRGDKTPISGVLPLTFKLYTSQDDKTPIWTAQHYVAVDMGTYTIDLGKTTPLPHDALQKERWLSVSIDDLGEVLREKIILTPYQPNAHKTPTHIHKLSFAELADRAVTADHAHVADNAKRLGGKTLKEINQYPGLYKQFVQLKAKVHSIEKSGGTEVARRTTLSDAAGTRHGGHFQLRCPDGQVMVGITGSVDDAVRSFKLICAPLERAK